MVHPVAFTAAYHRAALMALKAIPIMTRGFIRRYRESEAFLLHSHFGSLLTHLTGDGYQIVCCTLL